MGARVEDGRGTRWIGPIAAATGCALAIGAAVVLWSREGAALFLDAALTFVMTCF